MGVWCKLAAHMPVWVYNPHTGGKSIPPAVKAHTQQRILDYAHQHYAGRFTRIDVRFRGALCYIDAYTEPDTPEGSTPMHLCRIRYFGNADRWSFSWYSYAHEKYEPSFLITGADQGTPEEAFATSALFL